MEGLRPSPGGSGKDGGLRNKAWSASDRAHQSVSVSSAREVVEAERRIS
jgi:hypothetical protein